MQRGLWAPTCVFYTPDPRQGSCGVVPGPLLVFLIAPLNLWTAREPSHLTRYVKPARCGRDGGVGDNRAAFVVPKSATTPPTTNTIRVLTKGFLFFCFPVQGTVTCLTPAQTLLSQPSLTNGKKQYVLKLINYYYYRLCLNKESGDHRLFFLLLSYINWDFFLFFFVCFVYFDRDWIFNPMTKCISPCIVDLM